MPEATWRMHIFIFQTSPLVLYFWGFKVKGFKLPISTDIGATSPTHVGTLPPTLHFVYVHQCVFYQYSTHATQLQQCALKQIFVLVAGMNCLQTVSSHYDTIPKDMLSSKANMLWLLATKLLVRRRPRAPLRGLFVSTYAAFSVTNLHKSVLWGMSPMLRTDWTDRRFVINNLLLYISIMNPINERTRYRA